MVELRGARGGLAPWKTCGLRETSGLRGYKGACKRPPCMMKSPINKFLKHIILSTDADAFCSPKCDFLGLRGASEKFSRLFIARHILCHPLINYAIIRPLTTLWAKNPDIWCFLVTFANVNRFTIFFSRRLTRKRFMYSNKGPCHRKYAAALRCEC